MRRLGTDTQNREDSTKIDIVDLDPYGSASPFIDAALGCAEDGGLLCITCTDAAVLCGKHIGTCYAKYGATPSQGPFCHEMALRILLHAIEQSANRQGRYIHPLLSVKVDFYFRVYVQVLSGLAEVKLSVCKRSYNMLCTRCGFFMSHPCARTRARTRATKTKYCVRCTKSRYARGYRFSGRKFETAPKTLAYARHIFIRKSKIHLSMYLIRLTIFLQPLQRMDALVVVVPCGAQVRFTTRQCTTLILSTNLFNKLHCALNVPHRLCPSLSRVCALLNGVAG